MEMARSLAPALLLLLLLVLPPPALAASARRPAPPPPAPLARLRAAQAARSQAAAGGPVPCCPPFGPPAPQQFPSTYEARYFTQPVSHSNYLQPTDANNATSTFQQLFLYNDTYWAGPPAPIIFYTGAEGAGVDYIWPHSGWIVATLATCRRWWSSQSTASSDNPIRATSRAASTRTRRTSAR